MEMLSVAEFSPSFSRMSAGTIDYAVRHGAAKVDNFFPPKSIQSLLTNGLTNIPSLLVCRAPELQTYFEILGVDDEQVGNITTERLPVEANTGDIHTDAISPGLTLLVPLLGGKAIFGANNEPFSPDEIPGFVVEYGVTDVVVVRQGLTWVNDESVDYTWASHVGRGDTLREIASIHYRTSELNYELPQAA